MRYLAGGPGLASRCVRCTRVCLGGVWSIGWDVGCGEANWGVGRCSLVAEPIFEVGAGYAPFTPELDRGEIAAAELASYDKRGDVHVLADVGDGEPILL